MDRAHLIALVEGRFPICDDVYRWFNGYYDGSKLIGVKIM